MHFPLLLCDALFKQPYFNYFPSIGPSRIVIFIKTQWVIKPLQTLLPYFIE